MKWIVLVIILLVIFGGNQSPNGSGHFNGNCGNGGEG